MDDLLILLKLGCAAGGMLLFFACVVVGMVVESRLLRRLHDVDRARWERLGRPFNVLCLDLYVPPFVLEARVRLSGAIWRWAFRLSDPLRDDRVLRKWARAYLALLVIAGLGMLPLFAWLWSAPSS